MTVRHNQTRDTYKTLENIFGESKNCFEGLTMFKIIKITIAMSETTKSSWKTIRVVGEKRYIIMSFYSKAGARSFL